MTKRDAVRLGGILAGTGALFVGGLLVTSSPALADNGVHVSTSGNMTVDRCAGCHRAHTAQSSYLLMQDEVTLCTTCHGSSGTGAATDVLDGIGYTATGRGPVAGALRGGGFNYALINTASGVSKTSVAALTVAQVSSSGHSVDGSPQTAWGQGPINATANYGTAVNLACGSCHDPHGNGSWRILKKLPTGGAAITTPAVAALTSIVKNTTLSTGSSTWYDVTTSAANTFSVTDPVTVAGSTTPAANTIVGATVKVVNSATSFTISMSNSKHTAFTTTATGGNIGYALPNAIASITSDGASWTVTTWNKHGLSVGQTFQITGVLPAGTAPASFNANNLVVATATAGTNAFTVANTNNPPAYTGGGTISGTGSSGFIPDALPNGSKVTSVYTTTNYWVVDDHNYSGAAVASSTNPTAVIENISQWCATCHTRYMAGSGAWDVNSGDKVFTFRHRSQSPGDGSPNCLQCHVAHGSNATMIAGGESAKVPFPNPATSTSHTTVTGGSVADSRLLRVDNRGTCNMCHNL
jgi:predicted CXXCH cytochrome family protein